MNMKLQAPYRVHQWLLFHHLKPAGNSVNRQVFGRCFLLIASSIGIALSFVCLGLHFQLLELDYNPMSLTWLPCTCLILYTVAFSVGIGCIPSALVAELFFTETQVHRQFEFYGLFGTFLVCLECHVFAHFDGDRG